MLQRSPRASARRALAWPTALASLVAFAACSAPPGSELDDEGTPPEFGGSFPAATGAPGPGTSVTPPPGAAPASPVASANPTPPPGPASNEQPASSGTPIVPSTPPSNGNTGNGTNVGANSGAGGSGMVPTNEGDQGAGGSSMDVPTDQQPTPVTPPPVTPPPPAAGPDIPCPANATFCSGFESDVLPDGSIFQPQPVVPLEFDTTVKRTGNQSLKIVSAGGFNIREVVVPIPGQAFWVRLFVQTSSTFGDNDHDSLFVASTASFSQDNNAESGPEFSEQGNQIILNADDSYYSPGGPGFPQGEGPQLTPNTWHCEEAFYDGATGDTQIFSDGVQIIDAGGFTPRTYQTFRFGYIGFNTVRTVWFDDVVVSTDRIGCN